jgi:hypothetical protein
MSYVRGDPRLRRLTWRLTGQAGIAPDCSVACELLGAVEVIAMFTPARARMPGRRVVLFRSSTLLPPVISGPPATGTSRSAIRLTRRCASVPR